MEKIKNKPCPGSVQLVKEKQLMSVNCVHRVKVKESLVLDQKKLIYLFSTRMTFLSKKYKQIRFINLWKLTIQNMKG